MGGENDLAAISIDPPFGSSPRGRGKRVLRGPRQWALRLIPAWAGKTSFRWCRSLSCPAHPRVGGENFTVAVASSFSPGSSPRGRGKLRGMVSLRSQWGLIPAWAGKTRRSRSSTRRSRAHPRVGGENPIHPTSGTSQPGSSPRGRGKRRRPHAHPERRRLIPAWAGKTPRALSTRHASAAHPRVGGENAAAIGPYSMTFGSSPRGRGKLVQGVDEAFAGRLIPAWAGKTMPDSLEFAREAAHPRVGGENAVGRFAQGLAQGSSPRGRGKLTCPIPSRCSTRLIPAWAGKTDRLDTDTSPIAAHPRVGGENLRRALVRAEPSGSSPRGRGKP